MELKHYLTILWRRKLVVSFTMIVTAVITIIGTWLLTPVYQASVTLHIATPTRGTIDWIDYDTIYADRVMNTLVDLATNGLTRTALAHQFGLGTKPIPISVESVPNSELMRITVEDKNATLAAQLANAVAANLIAQSSALANQTKQNTRAFVDNQLAQLSTDLTQDRVEYKYLSSQLPDAAGRLADLNSSIKLKQDAYDALTKEYEQVRLREMLQTTVPVISEPAVAPTQPVKPNRPLNAALGLLIGLLGGLGLAVVLENLDTTLYTREQLESTSELALLGEIPSIKKSRKVAFLGDNAFLSEAFQLLRTNVTTEGRIDLRQTLLITSAEPGEGKSTIAANLAMALAQAGRKVALVDCDLRRPSLHELFKLPNEIGLSNVLSRYSTLAEALQSSKVSGLHIITSGPLPLSPGELLALPRTVDLLNQLEQQFDIVLLDTPALLAVADATILATLVDGVILVVSRGQTHKETAQAALHQLANVNAPLVGIIMNRALKGMNHYRYYQRKVKSKSNSIAL